MAPEPVEFASKPPASSTSQTSSPEEEFSDWVKTRLEAQNPTFVKVVDHKPWPSAPEPNTSIVLGIAKRPPQRRLAGLDYPENDYFPFILLVQAKPDGTNKMLASSYLEDLRVEEPLTGREENRVMSIDVTPIEIREGEYLFGVKLLIGSLGNKGGLLVELVSLQRYAIGRLSEVFRDVDWAFSLNSERDYKSCNVDMEMVSQPASFTITRRYKRSYLSAERTPSDQEVSETPCSLTERLRAPATHTWNSEKGRYLDSRNRFLQPDDFFKGWPF